MNILYILTIPIRFFYTKIWCPFMDAVFNYDDDEYYNPWDKDNLGI